jgi:glycosyltransferase involved in cell wall biosynthesis
MEKMLPLLSIVIATKNRVKYCINSIETILDYPHTDFELIVQDNTDNLELKEYVDFNFHDSRLIYQYTPPPFSSIDNFNAALELANGKYVCLIGDDDGVCSTLFEMVRWADKNQVDSVCPNLFVDFYWPGAFHPNGQGYLYIPWFSKKVWKKDPKESLQPLLEDGIIDYMRFNLPKLYHGLVRRSCFEEIKNINGYYIGGLSPDIYAAVSLSNIVQNHIVIDFPLTISGACKVSTTVAGFTGGHSGKLEDAPHLRDRGNYQWDPLIPRYYSVSTIWSESALKAIRETKIPVNPEKINLMKILIKSILDAPAHYHLFVNEFFNIKEENHNLFKTKLFFRIVGTLIRIYILKIFKRLRRFFFRKAVRQSPIFDVKEATAKTNLFLKNLDIDQIMKSL